MVLLSRHEMGLLCGVSFAILYLELEIPVYRETGEKKVSRKGAKALMLKTGDGSKS